MGIGIEVLAIYNPPTHAFTHNFRLLPSPDSPRSLRLEQFERSGNTETAENPVERMLQ